MDKSVTLASKFQKRFYCPVVRFLLLYASLHVTFKSFSKQSKKCIGISAVPIEVRVILPFNRLISDKLNDQISSTCVSRYQLKHNVFDGLFEVTSSSS